MGFFEISIKKKRAQLLKQESERDDLNKRTERRSSQDSSQRSDSSSKSALISSPRVGIPDRIPTEISGEYDNDLDLISIDFHVKKMFDAKLKLSFQIEEDIEEIDEKIRKFNGYQIDYIELLNKKKTLLNQASYDKIKKEYEKYVSETDELIEKYKPLGTKYRMIISSKNKNFDNAEIDKLKNTQRLKIINEYLSIVKKYMNINFISLSSIQANRRDDNGQQTEIECESCSEMLNLNEEVTCSCGLFLPIVSKLSSFKDSTRVTVPYSVYYEDLKNFIKAFYAFQGEQANKDTILPPTLFDELDTYFSSIGWKKGDYYRKLPETSSGKKEGTSFPDLISALDNIGRAEQYNNAHLIAKKYWGWRLMDLSEYQDQIVEDYKATQKIWDEEKDRDSSPNVKIRLYLHLRARGIPVSRRDFKFPVTSSCINYYNDKLKPIFKKCNLYYENLI